MMLKEWQYLLQMRRHESDGPTKWSDYGLHLREEQAMAEVFELIAKRTVVYRAGKALTCTVHISQPVSWVNKPITILVTPPRITHWDRNSGPVDHWDNRLNPTPASLVREEMRNHSAVEYRITLVKTKSTVIDHPTTDYV